MRVERLFHLTLVLSIALTTLVSCVSATADSTGEPSDAEVQAIVSKLPEEKIVGSSMMARSLDELVSGAGLIAVVRVTANGPLFNSRRTELDDKPDPRVYSIDQLHEVKVERWLKGSGPDTIWIDQYEGTVPEGFKHDKATIQAARIKSGITAYRVGTRLLVFLAGPTLQVPELKGFSWYPSATRLPPRFLLSSDGNAEVTSIRDPGSRAEVEKVFPKGPEKALVEKIERLVADTKK